MNPYLAAAKAVAQTQTGRRVATAAVAAVAVMIVGIGGLLVGFVNLATGNTTSPDTTNMAGIAAHVARTNANAGTISPALWATYHHATTTAQHAVDGCEIDTAIIAAIAHVTTNHASPGPSHGLDTAATLTPPWTNPDTGRVGPLELDPDWWNTNGHDHTSDDQTGDDHADIHNLIDTATTLTTWLCTNHDLNEPASDAAQQDDTDSGDIGHGDGGADADTPIGVGVDLTDPAVLTTQLSRVYDTNTTTVIVATVNHYRPHTGTGYAFPLPINTITAAQTLASHHTYPAWDGGVGVGTPLFAIVDATVIATSPDDGGRCGGKVKLAPANPTDGVTVVITYCHLSAVTATTGDTITAGTLIGLSGGLPGTYGAGNTTGPHLHLSIVVNGASVCPQTWLHAAHTNTTPPPFAVLPPAGCVFYRT